MINNKISEIVEYDMGVYPLSYEVIMYASLMTVLDHETPWDTHFRSMLVYLLSLDLRIKFLLDYRVEEYILFGDGSKLEWNSESQCFKLPKMGSVP